MADRTLTRQAEALTAAEAARSQLALSKLRLFDGSIVPDINTPTADLIAAETTLVGYPAGGYTLTAWGAPQGLEGGGVGIVSPSVAINYASGAAVVIGGAFVETAGGAAYKTYIFDPPIPLASIPDGFTFIRQLNFGVPGT